MIAFVLSGGGNRGALEVGALQALFAYGIRPDLVVGTSAGAMNAAFLATDPTALGADRLAGLWLKVRAEDVYPGGYLAPAWRLLTGKDSFYSGDALRRFVRRHMPPGVTTFADLKIPLYITAADLRTRTLYLFGDDLNAPLLDAVLASAAVPAILPPIYRDGQQLVDGGIVANVPISIALDKGAKTIYAINVGYSGEPTAPARGLLEIASRAIATMQYQNLLDDLERVSYTPGVTLHHIRISAFPNLSFRDFSHAAEMIAEGRRVTEEYLSNPQPVRAGQVLRAQWICL